MNFQEFERQVAQAKERSTSIGFSPFDERPVLSSELQSVEEAHQAILPEDYKRTLIDHGAGQFGFVDLLPVTAQDVEAVRSTHVPSERFTPIASLGTGDCWGFVKEGDIFRDSVHLLDHETGDCTDLGITFLEFMDRYALNAHP